MDITLEKNATVGAYYTWVVESEDGHYLVEAVDDGALIFIDFGLYNPEENPESSEGFTVIAPEDREIFIKTMRDAIKEFDNHGTEKNVEVKKVKTKKNK